MSKGISFEEALNLLKRYLPEGEHWDRHCLKVADVAYKIAEEIRKSGNTIDTQFTKVLGLLHDIGRYKSHKPVQHGLEGYILLREMGYEDIARICITHLFKGRKLEDAISGDMISKDDIEKYNLDNTLADMTIEEKVASLADVLVKHERVVTVDERYRFSNAGGAKWHDHNKKWALQFQSEVERMIGKSLYEVLNEV